jgi:protein TonB
VTLSLLALAGGAQAAAQGTPGLPACTPAEVERAPCRAPYEVAPVLAEVPAQPASAGEQRMPQVWMLVDATGAVRAARVERSAGVEWDAAAVERAKRFRFQPATRGGQPTPAWVMLAIPTVPLPPTCGPLPMGVPAGTGVGRFADSTVLEVGTRYRYRSVAGFDLDVVIYPAPAGASPRQEVEAAIAALRTGGADSLSVLSRGRERVRLYPNGGGTVTNGYAARLRVWSGGTAAESYVSVFPSHDGLLKFSATYPPGEEARFVSGEFARQILSERAWRARGCPPP